MSDIKENLLGSASKQTLQFVGNGIYLKSIEPKKKSAYEIYYENHIDEKKTGFEKKIPLKVIEEIIKSFKIEPKEYEEELQRKLIEGLMNLNKRSKTARKLIMQLYHGQEIKISDKDSAEGFVLKSETNIYFNKSHLLYDEVNEVAITLLHETGHLIEHEYLTPLCSLDKIYCDQHGKSIQGGIQYFSIDDYFKYSRLTEAEKRILEEQIFAECFPYRRVLLTSFGAWFSSKKIYSIILNTLMKLAPLKIDGEKQLKKEKNLRTMTNKLRRMRLWMKEAFKSRFSLFSKQGRLALEEKAFNQAVAHRMREFLLPQQEDEKNLKTRRNLSTKEICLDTLNFVFFIGYMIAASCLVHNYVIAPLKNNAINMMAVNKMAEVIKFGVLSLCGSGCLFARNMFKEALNRGNQFLKKSRDRWCDTYNYQAQRNSLRQYLNGRSNKKGMDLFVEAFCHKYQRALQPEDIKNSQTDQGEFEKENRKRRFITTLTKELQQDFTDLSLMIYACNKEINNASSKGSYVDCWNELYFNAYKIYLNQKKKVPFQKVMEDYLLQEIKAGDHFEIVARYVPVEAVKALRTPAFKKALYARKLKFAQVALKARKEVLFQIQKNYFKVLINQKNVKERD